MKTAGVFDEKSRFFDEKSMGFLMKITGVFDEKTWVFNEKRGVFDEKSADVTACSVLEHTQWNIPGPKSLWGSLRVSREVWAWNIPLCEFPNNACCCGFETCFPFGV